MQRANSLVMIENIDNRLTLKGELRQLPKQGLNLLLAYLGFHHYPSCSSAVCCYLTFRRHEPISGLSLPATSQKQGARRDRAL